MTEMQNTKQYDLEERTLAFARKVRQFLKQMPKTLSSIEDSKQLVRSSGSVGANYIEANEAISKKDFLLRIKICRKEAKESSYWLSLLEIGTHDSLDAERRMLLKESRELMMIFSAIMRKSQE